MNIHTPSIPSTTTTPTTTSDDVPTTRASLLSLITHKDALESELKALGAVLDSVSSPPSPLCYGQQLSGQHKVGMKTSLTTFDGFPRDDIDVAQIRTTRARIIRLRNDYNDLMKRIESGLHALHAAEGASEGGEVEKGTGADTEMEMEVGGGDGTVVAPFAKVRSVVPGSPAETAGLVVGDYIKRFGGATVLNHEKLARLAREVTANEGKDIRVLVSRRGEGAEIEKELTLVPRQGWGGRGMLGCHIVPL